MVEAQALIIFGNGGGQALFYEERNPYHNREGIKVRPILIVPSEELKKEYPERLTDEDLNILMDDGRKGLWVEYPVKQIMWLSRSKTGATILILCAFDGGKTNLMYYYKELLEWDMQRDKTEQRLRAQVSSLNHQLENATSIQVELFRQNKELLDVFEKKKDDDEK